MNAKDWVMGTTGDRVTTDKVMADLRVVAADMEELLKATAGQTGQQIAQVRARAEESLASVKARVASGIGVLLPAPELTRRQCIVNPSCVCVDGMN